MKNFFKKRNELQNHCIHSRKISAFLDAGKDSDFDHLTKHMLSCEICEAKLKETKSFLSKINRAIPIHLMEQELENDFKNDLREILKTFKLNEMNSRSKITINYLKDFGSAGSDILSVLLTKRMMAIYGISLCFVIFVKYLKGTL